MKARTTLLLSAALVLLVAVPLLAHHSFSAQFDRNQPVKFAGTVTKVEWMNPHVWFYVDAKDSTGKITHWECEATNPNLLARAGWTKDAMKAGDQVTVEGSRAHCCENVMNAQVILLAGGKRIFSGDANQR